MPIRKHKPPSPGRRFQRVHVFDELTTVEPYKPLTRPLPKSGGRNIRGGLLLGREEAVTRELIE